MLLSIAEILELFFIGLWFNECPTWAEDVKVIQVPHLLGNGSDVFERERCELVLLEKIVEILLEHFEDETSVVLVLEAFVSPHEIEIVRTLLQKNNVNLHIHCFLSPFSHPPLPLTPLSTMRQIT